MPARPRRRRRLRIRPTSPALPRLSEVDGNWCTFEYERYNFDAGEFQHLPHFREQSFNQSLLAWGESRDRWMRATKSGSISKEAFFEAKVPAGAVVFKDPLTAPASLYVTEAGKTRLEDLVAQAGITGLAFVEPGQGLKKPRPRA